MNLSLRLAVYKGGEFWRECWNTIKENIDIFDCIYISFNYSELQQQDIALIENFNSDKIKWRKENRMLSAVEHGRNIDRFLKHCNVSGHVLILCHDDLLVREGLLKLKQLSLGHNEAAWLGADFFTENGMPVPEVCRKDIVSDQKIPVEKFLCDLPQRALNVSRIVLPAEIYYLPQLPWNNVKYGYFAEIFYLCNSMIHNIQQLSATCVRIRMHSGSEGALRITSLLLYDSLLAFGNCMLIFDQKQIHLVIARHVGYMIKKNILSGIWNFFAVQKILMKSGHYKFTRMLKFIGYLFYTFLFRTGKEQ